VLGEAVMTRVVLGTGRTFFICGVSTTLVVAGFAPDEQPQVGILAQDGVGGWEIVRHPRHRVLVAHSTTSPSGAPGHRSGGINGLRTGVGSARGPRMVVAA
jgi:hypothetical protein